MHSFTGPQVARQPSSIKRETRQCWSAKLYCQCSCVGMEALTTLRMPIAVLAWHGWALPVQEGILRCCPTQRFNCLDNHLRSEPLKFLRVVLGRSMENTRLGRNVVEAVFNARRHDFAADCETGLYSGRHCLSLLTVSLL